MHVPVDFRDEPALGKFFDWITQYGMGRYFGSLPIGWYQSHQCHVHDILCERLGVEKYGEATVDLRVHKSGLAERRDFDILQAKVDGKWKDIASTGDIFKEADRRCRQ